MELIHKSGQFEKYLNEINNIIETASNYLLYGESHDEPFFDTFCEYNFMAEYLYLVDEVKNQDINLSIVKSFAFLISNLKNEVSIYFIFSNNFINHIISNINFFEYGEDFLSYYINFLKSLSLKLNATTIQFFFHKDINSFPLLENAIKLYNNPDQMINNVVSNIFLSICKLKYRPVEDYLCSLPAISYFEFISCRLRDMIITFDKELRYENFRNIQDDIITNIIYIQDIFSLGIDKINYVLTNCLMYYCVLPLIVSIIQSNSLKISITLALYVLCLLFHYIKDENFINILYTLVFLPKRNKSLNKYIDNYPNDAKNYYYDWEKQKKQTFNSFQEYVDANLSKPFLKSLIYMKNSEYKEIKEIADKFEKLCEKDDYNVNSENFLTTITNDVLSYFQNSEINIMVSNHQNISKATGVHCGLSTKDIKRCVIKKIGNLYKKYFNEKDKKLINNDTRSNLIQFLNNKDDNLILLDNLLLYEMLKSKNEGGVIYEGLQREGKMIQCEGLTQDEIDECIKENNEEFADAIEEKKEDLLDIKDIKISDNNIVDTNKQLDQYKVSLKEFVNDSSISSSTDTKNTLCFENFNTAYFTSLNIQKHPYRYEDNIITLLLNFLNPSIPLRIITIKVIFENLSRILIKGGKTIISSKHKKMIEQAYINYLTEIKQLFLHHQSVKSKSYTFFESLHKEYNTSINIKELLEKPYLILPFNIKDYDEEQPKQIQIINQEDYKRMYKTQLYTFMNIHDLVMLIDEEGEDKKIKNKFPLGDNDINLNEQIMISDLGAGIEKYECKMKKSRSSNKEYVESLILIYNNKLYIGNLSSNVNYLRFKIKFLLSECNIQTDRAEPRVLHLIVMGSDEEVIDDNCIDLMFPYADTTINVKRNIEENVNNAKIMEQCYFESYIDDLMREWSLKKK